MCVHFLSLYLVFPSSFLKIGFLILSCHTFYMTCIRENMQYLSIWVLFMFLAWWCPDFSIFLRQISLIFKAEYYFTMYIYLIFFIPSSLDGHIENSISWLLWILPRYRGASWCSYSGPTTSLTTDAGKTRYLFVEDWK